MYRKRRERAEAVTRERQNAELEQKRTGSKGRCEVRYGYTVEHNVYLNNYLKMILRMEIKLYIKYI